MATSAGDVGSSAFTEVTLCDELLRSCLPEIEVARHLIRRQLSRKTVP